MFKHASLLMVFALAATTGHAAEALPKMNIDAKEMSVSGLSSGGYMAMQFHSVYSASVKGVGIIAAGPYHCSGDNSSGQMLFPSIARCMQGSPDAKLSVEKLKSNAAADLADPVENLEKSRVYMFVGTKDAFVSRSVLNSLFEYYKALVPAERIKYINDKETAHAFLTDSASHSACLHGGMPAVNNCGYDQAGDILQWIYDGKLKARRQKPSGRIVAFDQAEFAGQSDTSLDDTGYLFVPAECDGGAKGCKLHVVFHGCGQSARAVRDAVYGNAGAGYNQWADANGIVVLYPQVRSSFMNPENQMGCWDWWGYTGSQWDTKQGKQVRAIRAMVDRLTSGQQ